MIVDIREQPNDQSGVANSAVSEQATTRHWYLLVDSQLDNPSTIKSDSRWLVEMPSYGAPHPDDQSLSLRSISLNRNGKTSWLAVGNYSAQSFDPEEEEKEQVPNPIDRLPKFSIDIFDRQKYSMKDIEGKAYQSSSKEPFPPQVTEVTDCVIRVRTNVAKWTPSWFNVNNKINLNQVKIYDGYSTIIVPAKRGLLKGPKLGELQKENGYAYYTLTADVYVTSEEDGWKHKIIDTGFNQLSGTEITRIKVKADNGSGELVDCVTEQLLNGSGMPLYPDGVYDAGKEPFELEFDKYKVAAWTLPFFT